MSGIQLLAKELLDRDGSYYRLVSSHKTPIINRGRLQKLEGFLAGLQRSGEWLSNNVVLIHNKTREKPPEQFRSAPSCLIGNSETDHLWAVIRPPISEIEFLEGLLAIDGYDLDLYPEILKARLGEIMRVVK